MLVAKWIEHSKDSIEWALSLSTPCLQIQEVKAFSVSCVDLQQKLAVSAARKYDIITRALDSLFVLARTTLNVQDLGRMSLPLGISGVRYLSLIRCLRMQT